MELQEGQMYTNIQLAQWFGIKVNYFNHVKEKKLLQLRQYFADYQITNKGKIKILKVYNPIYTKRGARVKAIIHENFDRIWGTCCKQDPDIDTTSKEGAYIPATLEQFKEFELKYKGVLYTTEGIIGAAP